MHRIISPTNRAVRREVKALLERQIGKAVELGQETWIRGTNKTASFTPISINGQWIADLNLTYDPGMRRVNAVEYKGDNLFAGRPVQGEIKLSAVVAKAWRDVPEILHRIDGHQIEWLGLPNPQMKSNGAYQNRSYVYFR